MKPAIFKPAFPILLILISLTGIAYRGSKFFNGEWGNMDNEGKFSVIMAIFLYVGIFIFGAGRLNLKKNKGEIEEQV